MIEKKKETLPKWEGSYFCYMYTRITVSSVKEDAITPINLAYPFVSTFGFLRLSLTAQNHRHNKYAATSVMNLEPYSEAPN